MSTFLFAHCKPIRSHVAKVRGVFRAQYENAVCAVWSGTREGAQRRTKRSCRVALFKQVILGRVDEPPNGTGGSSLLLLWAFQWLLPRIVGTQQRRRVWHIYIRRISDGTSTHSVSVSILPTDYIILFCFHLTSGMISVRFTLSSGKVDTRETGGTVFVKFFSFLKCGQCIFL